MKNTPKCPLCGTPLKAIRDYDVQGVTTNWVAGCYNCFFQSSHFWKTKKACLEDMDRLVSLFPPLLRVQVGDKIKVWHHQGQPDEEIYTGTVREIYREDGFMKVDEEDGLILFPYPTGIAFWPWELEQEGGQQ